VKRSIIAVILAVSVAAAAVLAAASSGSASEAKKASKGVIGVSYPTVEGPWFTAALYGMQSQAKKRGYDIVIQSAGGYQNVDTQVSQMTDLIQRRVSGILQAVSDAKALAPQVVGAQKAGIPVIAAGEQENNVTASVTASHCTVGKQMAASVKKLLPKGGNLAALTGPAGTSWTVDRWNCFKKALKRTNIKIVAQQWSDPSVSEGLRIAQDMLQRNPGIQVIYGADDTVGVGAVRAVQQGPGCSKVKVVTSVLDATSEPLVRNGCIAALVAQQVVTVGKLSVDTLITVLHKQKVAKVVEVPNIVVTPQNIKTLKRGTIQAPKGWKPSIG
jgi:ribose transport system substrate-binding protein